MAAAAKTIYPGLTIDPVICCNCGVTFGMDREHIAQLHRTRGTFYCPGGHPQHYRSQTHEEEIEELRGHVAAERSRYAVEASRHETTRHRLAGTKGALTQTKRRANAGVCLDCSRFFQQVERHRARMHPGKS